MAEKYDFTVVEQDVLTFWKSHKIEETVRKRNKDKKKFYFCQGPPYTSGKLHIGHAWNSAMKDMVLRYKRMQGFDVWDRAGYDVHGLPTELKTADKLGLKNKEEIEIYGVDNFVRECRAFAEEHAGYMNEDLKRIGVSMNYDNAYFPMDNTYMENQWWFIKNAYDQDRIYLGDRTLSWCSDCETALAKHEQEYASVADKSIYVKFQRVGHENEYLIIWTTTPWTIPFNLGVMVNPESKYVKVKVDDEFWYLAEDLVDVVVTEKLGKKFTVIENMTGDKLEGMRYTHFFTKHIPSLGAIDADKVHSVVLSKEYVDTTSGTGLVHMAPGCGPEDFEVGYRNGLPAYNEVTEQGLFPESMGKFAGLRAKIDDKKFIQAMEDEGSLLYTESVVHDYAHCWRCHKPIIYRKSKQWFLKIEDLKKNMIEHNTNTHWVPSVAREMSNTWIENLRDNSITRQRLWGTPFPLWTCVKCEHHVMIGSRKELKDLAITDIPQDLHKPFIDKIELECSKCNSKMLRHPDILDVWLDSGSLVFNCLDYPTREDWFKRYFNIDFILEAKEQIRLWFYMLSLTSEVAFRKQAFKAVYATGMLTGIDGQKMSKSLGNIISPYELIDKYGADTMRNYLCSIGAGVNVSFSWEELGQRYKNLFVFWNIHNYLLDLQTQHPVTDMSISSADMKKLTLEDRYILARLHGAIKEVTHLMDNYHLDKVSRVIEGLMFELSRTYIQQIRERYVMGSSENKELVTKVIYNVFHNATQMYHLVCPFITDKMYFNMEAQWKTGIEAIHLCPWPSYNEKFIDETLVESMDIVKDLVAQILSARDQAKIGVRWPLSKVVINAKKVLVNELSPELLELIKTLTNVKEIVFDIFEMNYEAKPNFRSLGQKYGTDTHLVLTAIKGKDFTLDIKAGKTEFEVGTFTLSLDDLDIKKTAIAGTTMSDSSVAEVCLMTKMTPELEEEGYAREVTRRIQVFRKNQGLKKTDMINLGFSFELEAVVKRFSEEIKTKCQISSFVALDEKKDSVTEKIKGKILKLQLA